MQVPSLEPEEDLVVRPADDRRRADASRLLLRLPARVVSRRQPAAARSVVRRGRRARPAALRLQRRAGMSALTGRRRAGLLIPLFSCPSTASWGIGDIGDRRADRPRGWRRPASACCSCCRSTRWRRASSRRIRRSARWRSIRSSSACRACPSSRRSAARPRCRRRSRRARRRFAARRASTTRTVRRLKHAALRAAFERFLEAEWRRDTRARARRCAAFVSEQAWWIEDYALFRAHPRARGRAAVDRVARARCSAASRRRSIARAASSRDEVLFYQYLQWLADTQWQRARERTHGVAAVRRSAVHGRRRQRRRLGAAGPVPSRRVGRRAARRVQRDRPGLGHAALSTGTSWPPRTSAGCASARAAAPISSTATASITSSASTAPTAGRSDGGEPFFTPADEPAQLALGERLLELFRGAGAEIIAEDLGTVPDFVRASLARLGVPGFRVFRWERHWHTTGQPFRDPSEYPPRLGRRVRHARHRAAGVWWEQAPRGRAAEGRAICRSSSGSPAAPISSTRRSSRSVRDVAARGAVRVGLGPAARCRCRTSSAGAIASTSRRPSPTTTGRSACRGRSTR